MYLSTLFVLSLMTGPVAQTSRELPRRINRSVKLSKGEYLMPAPGDERGAGTLVIEGDDLTIDFNGAVLRGAPEATDPDARKGVGIEVRGRNITLINPRVHGYKVGLIARNAPGLKILGGDFSYNWKQRLKSTLEKEDLSDWMSYHQNEKDEWLRYGAAIYLKNSPRFEVKGVRVVGGQNALMLTGSNGGLVWNNDFSFNSSLGLGMYRSSNNRIMHNRMDWNVRGFSYGVYNRGQDSAGILMFEQCHRNTVAYNSVTHGGDGFFLWAGQTTMDTGRGGCNDNLLYGNDFSHAPTNGIEVTFSRNLLINNKIQECAHGIWGGYSYDTVVLGNEFSDNQAAIAIEHGQSNLFQDNSFFRDDVAVSLWANEKQDPNWEYPKRRDTASRDAVVTGNLFQSVGLAMDLRRTRGTVVGGNEFRDTPNKPRQDALSDIKAIETAFQSNNVPTTWDPFSKRANLAKYRVAPLAGGINPFLKPDALRGWRYILVDDWGPYDFRRPLLWPERKPLEGEAPRPGANSAAGSGRPKATRPKEEGPVRYEILGPKGRWRLVSAEGAKLSATSGTVPGFVTIDTEKGRVGRTKVELEYIGGDTYDARGVRTSAGTPVRFGMDKFVAPIDWSVKFFKWQEATDPSDVHSTPKEDALQAIFKGQPLKEVKLDRLDYAGYAFDAVTGNSRYATIAEGSLSIPEGEYVLELTTDDGARVWLDGKPLITDAWKYQGPTAYTRTVRLGGQHKLRVEHFQIDGYATLRLNIRPK